MEFLLLYIYLAFFALQLIFILILGWSYQKKNIYSVNERVNFSVVIPLRDEADRILPLLNAINELKIPNEVQVEFILVNDHSVDESINIINETLTVDFKIIENDQKGKKHAIRSGVQVARHDHILTWDADIELNPDYFKVLTKLPDAEMWILPVKMKSDQLLGKLASVDFNWLQILTYVFCRWKNPFLNNGANLMFKKTAFMDVDRIRSDYEEASGDDLFLLARFREMNKSIKATSARSLQVETNAPSGFQEILTQRKRWSGKMKALIDLRSGALFIYLLLVEFAFISNLMYALLFTSWIFIIPIGIKITGEYCLLRFYKGKQEVFLDIGLTIIHQLFFPLYLLGVLLAKSKYDSRWEH